MNSSHALRQSRMIAGYRGSTPDNLPDRPLARIRIRTRSELDPQRVAEVLLQGGVVGLRRGNLGL
jgi:hypothetical protein